MFELHIPCLPITVNKAYPTSRSGRRFKSPELKRFNDIVHRAMFTNEAQPEGRLSVEIELYADWYIRNGSIRKIDCDNYIKTLVDSVFANLDSDDCQIWDLKVSKVDGLIGTRIRIYELDNH